jgi:hypothetical protein
MLEIFEELIDPSQNVEFFDDIDEEMADRASTGEFKLADCVKVLQIIFQHNDTCPPGYEIGLDLFIEQCQKIILDGFPALTRNQFLEVICGFACSG